MNARGESINSRDCVTVYCVALYAVFANLRLKLTVSKERKRERERGREREREGNREGKTYIVKIKPVSWNHRDNSLLVGKSLTCWVYRKHTTPSCLPLPFLRISQRSVHMFICTDIYMYIICIHDHYQLCMRTCMSHCHNHPEHTLLCQTEQGA
ncbi:hypothetical protein POVWA2_007200 [Plasmodium ovale wallikeri]|uniref:Uncharacterized protein n=1 Tax=Plasmodium ovale wallikeri TaxID=864142 RepID=A0A1A8YKW5_PLAOA|nr:hypothetical protein POVWA2_007200 [Plasmodium ovale wallikeri]